MIIVGNKKGTILNPAQIVSFEVVKGKTSVYVKGDNDGDTINIRDVRVKEPWTVVIKTTKETYYINHTCFESAVNKLVQIAVCIDDLCDTQTLERSIRKTHGQ